MEDSVESNDGTQEISERSEIGSPTVTRSMDPEVTEEPKSDIGVEFIKTAATNASLNTNTAENLSSGNISGTATLNFESESDDEYVEEPATDDLPN